MKILSVNAGSSSLKFQAYEMPEEKVLISGVFERIGIDGQYSLKINGKKIKKEASLKTHEDAVRILANELVSNGIVQSLDEIEAVGHRIVHGGEKYSDSVLITEDVLKTVEELSDLAPLHNPANLVGIRAFMSEIPNAIEVGCFDTAFHHSIKEENYLYAVPSEWYQKYGVRKYGFHGMSHKYVSGRASELLSKKDANIIVCHLGNGGSLSAVKEGKCIDTTMGFTPNAGIIMGSRSGDIDYTMIPYMMKKTGKNIEEIDTILNKQSGMLALSGISSDFRDIEEKLKENDHRAILSHEMFVNSVVGYIAKYYLELGTVDAICFTAGVGENSSYVRKLIIEKLKPLGIELDETLNHETCFGKEGIITKDSSSIPCFVIPTNEELMIVRDTYKFAK